VHPCLLRGMNHAANRKAYGKTVTTSRTSKSSSPTLMPPGVHEALLGAGQRTTCGLQRKRPPLPPYNPMVKMKVTREGERRDEPAPRRDRSQGIRNEPFFEIAKHELPCCPSWKGRAREHGPYREVHGQLLFQPQDLSGGPRRDDPSTTRFSVQAGTHTSGWENPVS